MHSGLHPSFDGAPQTLSCFQRRFLYGTVYICIHGGSHTMEIGARHTMGTTTRLKPAPHSPTLDTQLMIESCIRAAGSFPSRRALMRALPRQVEYPTLAKILLYLEASNKILLAENGSIVWVFADSPKLLRLLAESPAIRSADTQTSTNT
jgi:hypothetical protein